MKNKEDGCRDGEAHFHLKILNHLDVVKCFILKHNIEPWPWTFIILFICVSFPVQLFCYMKTSSFSSLPSSLPKIMYRFMTSGRVFCGSLLQELQNCFSYSLIKITTYPVQSTSEVWGGLVSTHTWLLPWEVERLFPLDPRPKRITGVKKPRQNTKIGKDKAFWKRNSNYSLKYWVKIFPQKLFSWKA